MEPVFLPAEVCLSFLRPCFCGKDWILQDILFKELGPFQRERHFVFLAETDGGDGTGGESVVLSPWRKDNLAQMVGASSGPIPEFLVLPLLDPDEDVTMPTVRKNGSEGKGGEFLEEGRKGLPMLWQGAGREPALQGKDGLSTG